MTRRWTAAVLALVLSGAPALPIFASASAGCASCAGAARCCCAPAKGAGGCGLGRACASQDGALQPPQDAPKAVVETSPSRAVPPAPERTLRRETSAGPLDLPSVPPDPPPRPSL